MIAPDDIAALIAAVEARFPRHKFTAENASDLLAGVLRGDGTTRVSDVSDALSWYAAQFPDDAKPSWERVAGRMKTVGTLCSDGVAALRRTQAEVAESRRKLDAALAELDAVPADQWPEVCRRACGKSLTQTNSVPPDWQRKPSWVWLLSQAWTDVKAAGAAPGETGRMF